MEGMHFTVIALSAQRKFLSAQKFAESKDVPAYVAMLLQRDMIGSISIKRVEEKQKKQ